MKKTKVFGIGFHKTATTSLADALTLLGYNVTGPDGAHDPEISEKVHSLVYELADKFDAFQDNPWPLFYKELDEKYPNSKFILTTRPTDKWIDSQVKHFGKKTTPMRKWIYGDVYGAPEGNESIYTSRYDNHNNEVLEYFKDRPDDFLHFKLTEGDGWDSLCNFLGESVPNKPFPKSNTRELRESNRSLTNRLVNKVKHTLFG